MPRRASEEALRRVASCILSFKQETTMLSMDLPQGFTGICRDIITVFCLVRCKKEPASEDTETNCRDKGLIQRREMEFSLFEQDNPFFSTFCALNRSPGRTPAPADREKNGYRNEGSGTKCIKKSRRICDHAGHDREDCHTKVAGG